jgi:rhamnosyltransferase
MSARKPIDSAAESRPSDSIKKSGSVTRTNSAQKTGPNPGPVPVPIVMRARNDMPLIGETLNMVSRQTIPYTLIAFDNDSDDGTTELLRKYTEHIHRVPAGTYIPGAVLNRAMEAADPEAPFVVFLNSDCTPADENWLEQLISGFAAPDIAAVFGRQLPRPDALPLFAKDTEDTFGDGSRQKYWRHCFSMASSAVRRSCWETMPFRSDLKYSEDIDWTWRAREAGWKIQYVQESRVYHSHNYTLSQFASRQRGEGTADAQIFTWSSWDRSFLRYSLLPLLRQIKSDWGYALRTRSLQALLHSPALRFSQMTGRRRGFIEGLRESARESQRT